MFCFVYQKISDAFETENIKLKKWQHGKVLLHLPCTYRNHLNEKSFVEHFEQVKGLKIKVIDWGCCGSAGSHLFTHFEQVQKLGEQMMQQTIEQIESSGETINDYEYLVTNNIGCKIQWYQILKSRKSKIKVLHPLEFFQKLI